MCRKHTKKEKRALEITRAADKRYPIYGAIDPDYSELNAGFVEGAEWSDRNPQNPWRSMTTDGEPERSMFVLANLGFNYIVCEYKADVKEWWQCDGYIAGYSPERKPLFSAKTKLTPKEVELIINYMEIPNEPNEDEDYE